MEPRIPTAKEIPSATETFGYVREDPFAWMRYDKNATLTYISEESSYTEKCTAHLRDLQNTLIGEMKARMQDKDITFPTKKGGYYYFTVEEPGNEFAKFCRRLGEDGETEVLLDLNLLTTNSHYLNLSIYSVSPNHRFLAYALDSEGNENYTLYVRNLETGTDLSKTINNVGRTLEWLNDSSGFYYVINDEKLRPSTLYLHDIEEYGFTMDDEIYYEVDKRFSIGLYKTKNEAYIALYIFSLDTTEVLISNSSQRSNFKKIQQRIKGVEYFVENIEEDLYISTNLDAPNNKIVRTPLISPSVTHWTDLVTHSRDVLIEDFEVFSDFIVLYERRDSYRKIRVVDITKNIEYNIELPEEVSTYETMNNPDFCSNRLRFMYMSFLKPDTLFEFDLHSRSLKVLKEITVDNFEADNYVSERIWINTDDDQKVPVSLVYKQELSETRPCLLHAHGAYGINMEPWFSSNIISLLDRGVIFGIAHVRGGQELGRKWYEEGKLLNKKNSFSDFIACAKGLFNRGYTSPEQLAVMGSSAGAMLIGAVLNIEPSLAHVAVIDVPFLDVLSTMLDDSLPLTIGEYDEWGNPKEKIFFEYIYSYSPYDNIREDNYPNILVTGTMNDARVQFWEPVKWVAKLRKVWRSDKLLLLKMETEAGHGGVSGRYRYLSQTAFEYAFILDRLGLKYS